MNEAVSTSPSRTCTSSISASPRPCRLPPWICPSTRLRVDRAPDVLRDGQLDHPRDAELRVDVDHRAVGGEREGEVRVALPALVQRLRRGVVVLARRLHRARRQQGRQVVRPQPLGARAASSSRTASHASFTAPPAM